MPSMRPLACLTAALVLVVGCAPSQDPPVAEANPAGASATAAAPAPPEMADAAGSAALPSAGMATVDLVAEGVAVQGEYPATLCAGPYLMGEGLAYQTTADGWEITVAVEGERRAGTLVVAPGSAEVGVVATVNGPGRQFVRKRSLGGTLTISDDFRRASADLELGEVVGRETARLKVDFACR